jgi:tetratricopeptide (TPR) repeat protein
MSGDGAGALAVGRPAIDHVLKAKTPSAWDQLVAGTAYAAEGRFGEPVAVLALAEPSQPYLQAMWRYARGEALARTGDVAGLKREAALVRRDAGQLKDLKAYAGQIAQATDLAALVLEGRAAMLERRYADAAGIFRKAAELEETKFNDITDPPMWWYATLTRRVHDPITLAILARAERKLGMGEAADAHLAEARKAWAGDAKGLEIASL